MLLYMYCNACPLQLLHCQNYKVALAWLARADLSVWFPYLGAAPKLAMVLIAH